MQSDRRRKRGQWMDTFFLLALFLMWLRRYMARAHNSGGPRRSSQTDGNDFFPCVWAFNSVVIIHCSYSIYICQCCTFAPMQPVGWSVFPGSLWLRERERIVAIDFCCVACHVQTMFNACSIRIACLLRNLYSWSNKNENKNIQSEMRTQTHKYMRDVDGNNNTTTTN